MGREGGTVGVEVGGRGCCLGEVGGGGVDMIL